MAVGGKGLTVVKFAKAMGGNNRPRETGPAPGDLPLPARLQGTLERFRERLWSVKIAEGALAGILGLGVSYLLVFLLDRFIDTPASVRVALLAAGFTVPALGLPWLWHRWVWRQRTLGDAARYLKRRYPEVGDELLGIVELAHQHADGQSEVLIHAAMRQVDERVAGKDFSDAVPTRRYRKRLAGVAVLLALAGGLLFLVSDAARNALARWVSPWKAVDRYTFAQLDPVPEKLFVPFAEPFPLSAGLAKTTEWRPEEASVRLPGKTRLSAARDADRYAFAIPPQKEPGKLSLRVGDAREGILVEPLPRPELASLEAEVRLPDYLRYSKDPVVPVRGNTLTLVEGSEATIRGTTTRELAAAQANGDALAIMGAGFTTAPLKPGDGVSRTFTWKDVHGLEAKAPLDLTLASVPDEAPELYAHQVDAKRMILEDEVVTFDVNANDDFGLREVGLEWRLAESGETAGRNPAGEKPVAAGGPEKTTVQARGTFSAKREGIAPGTYQVRAFANDFLPNRPRILSPAFVLHILSPQEHAKWLTEEFAKWFRNARETYEREQQLHESNLALRELSPEALDRPENRRRLQDQASAESANARRLDALTAAGRGLVGEAAKNPEFDAKRLERWAEMMRALDQIARERMPTVADLLQQASRAPGAPAAQTPQPPQPPQESPDKTSNAPSQPSPPSLGDREKSLTPEKKPEEPGGSQAPGSTAPLRLPSTSLAAAGDEAKPEAAETPARKTLDRALEEQKKLLEEFARVADELAAILASLEASTFVKRLKLASRKQTELADALSGTLSGSFGLPRQRVGQQIREVGETVAKAQDEQSRFVHHIQTDLEAYFQRKQDPVYRNVLDQMKVRSIVPGLRAISAEALGNLNGRSVAAAEFWADTLDRWAEELVAAAPPQEGQGQEGDAKSLPPEIVLRVMKVLQEEMQLRDETREMEETRPAFAPDVYESKVRPLSTTQSELRERIDEVVTDISELPEAGDFGNEVQLLSLVSDIMRQAHAVLLRPDTGPEAIAFETEVIELLLQSKRQQSGGGGGGGGSNSGSGNNGGGKGSALSDIGPQDRATEGPAPLNREVEQSTGKAGRELPEEFRRGLDSYFNELDAN